MRSREPLQHLTIPGVATQENPRPAVRRKVKAQGEAVGVTNLQPPLAYVLVGEQKSEGLRRRLWECRSKHLLVCWERGVSDAKRGSLNHYVNNRRLACWR